MYIGTGETYAYGISTNGLTDRTTRGTFGIGILKSVDGGIPGACRLIGLISKIEEYGK